MKTKHTPLPWHVEHTEQHKYRDDQHQVYGPDGQLICDLLCPDLRPANEANAAFIVRACNSHYELLEALKHASALLEATGMYFGNDRIAAKSMHVAAIAKAEGK